MELFCYKLLNLDFFLSTLFSKPRTLVSIDNYCKQKYKNMYTKYDLVVFNTNEITNVLVTTFVAVHRHIMIDFINRYLLGKF